MVAKNMPIEMAFKIKARLFLRMWPLSDEGQSRPNWAVRAMSGLPWVAIRLRTCRIGSFVPEVANRERHLGEITANFVATIRRSPFGAGP
jgi:hypothetical protein